MIQFWNAQILADTCISKADRKEKQCLKYNQNSYVSKQWYNGHDGLMYNAFLTLALPKISQDCIIPCLFSCIHFSFLSNTGQWSPVCQRTIVLHKDNNDKKLFVSVEHFNCFWLYMDSMVFSDINFATFLDPPLVMSCFLMVIWEKPIRCFFKKKRP